MRKRAARAFTLIEMVILLFLAGVILFAVSRLTRETYKSLVFLREKAQTYESAVLGVERLLDRLDAEGGEVGQEGAEHGFVPRLVGVGDEEVAAALARQSRRRPVDPGAISVGLDRRAAARPAGQITHGAPVFSQRAQIDGQACGGG